MANNSIKILNREAVFDNTLSDLSNAIVSSDTIEELYTKIIQPDTKCLLFSDEHGIPIFPNFLKISIPHVKSLGFDTLIFEMLPVRDLPYTMDEINEYYTTTSGWGVFNPTKNYIPLLSECINNNITIYGGDIRPTDKTELSKYKKNADTFTKHRYAMNEKISTIIKTLIDDNHKVLTFYGKEHNNTRTTDCVGIPYYLTLYKINFLVLKLLYNISDKTQQSYILSFVPSELKKKYSAIKTTPKVDYPNYFIIIGDPILLFGGKKTNNKKKSKKKKSKKKKSKKKKSKKKKSKKKKSKKKKSKKKRLL
jgi:hypothetical protein